MNNLRNNIHPAAFFIQSMIAEKQEKKNQNLAQSSKIKYCMHTDYDGGSGHVDCSTLLMAAHEDSHMDHYVKPTWADYQNESGGRHGDEHIDREY